MEFVEDFSKNQFPKKILPFSEKALKLKPEVVFILSDRHSTYFMQPLIKK
jgi:hypothetical protein